ncbi:sigma-70 family RNA polymerase sigma factor [Verrucomicrobiaceae bacterium 227]
MMNLTGADNLWPKFRSGRSETVFAEIVKQHSGMVYSTALRCSDGVHEIAEEIMQEVFCDLVGKSKSLPPDLCLGGWLYRHTCHLAANRRRSETRRRKREMIAMEMMNDPSSELPPEVIEKLDEALCSLPKSSREMLVMHFFESSDFRRIAVQFGITDEAARKRISRSLEKLRAFFAKRGVTVSSVTLAAGLSASSAGKVSAARQIELVRQAMTVPVAAGGTGIAAGISAFLVGVLSVSGVAVGIQKWPVSSNPAPAVLVPQTSSRSSPSDRSVGPKISNTKEDLFARLQSLSDGPQHALAIVELRALLAEITVAEIPDFVETSRKRLSPAARKFCNNILCARWIDHEPATNLLNAMRENLGFRSGVGTWLYRTAAGRWADKDPEAMMRWLLVNEDEIKKRRLSGPIGPLFYDFSQSIVDSFLYGPGIEKALESLAAFPAETRTELLQHLTGAKLTGLRASNAPILYQYLKTHSDDESLWTKFLRKWAEKDPEALLATLDGAQAPERFRDKLLLFKGIRPTGPPVEQADGTITMSTRDGKVYASLAERERQVYQAGVEAGFSLEEIQKGIVDAHLGPNSQSSFLKSEQEGQLPDRAELELRIANLEKSQRDSKRQFGPAESYHTLIWESVGIADEALRREVCESLFSSFLRHDPEQAREFSTMPHLPEDLKESFQSLTK